jgi:DNA topoisomerase VI subunit B
MKQETVTYNRQSNISQNQSIDISIDPNNMIQAFEAFVNYSYPLKSIIREITSNCFDAHIAIDIDHHVEIRYSKTEFGRMLIFRDFGIGLDEDRMNNIFIHMFRSDKRESNRLIGTFGMGSKSPFGYTDMFYVESLVECI